MPNADRSREAGRRPPKMGTVVMTRGKGQKQVVHQKGGRLGEAGRGKTD